MIQIEAPTEAEVLTHRLARGADLLFDMERRGEVDGEYSRYLHLWEDLLERYEELQAA